jgi:hypothetical protein
VWRHISQSVSGRHHRNEGAECQDSCLVRLLGDEPDVALVACVADGAGSCAFSAFGAQLACQSIIQCAESHFAANGGLAGLDAEAVLQWCDEARRSIGEHAEANNRQLRDYASTLCASVITPGGSIFFQIGDGAIVACKNQVIGVVFWPQSGEYINTTNFLTSPEYREQVQVCATADGFSEVALITDGLERLALQFHNFTPYPPFFQPLFGALRSAPDPTALSGDLRLFLQSDSIQNKNDDDKTLVLASRFAP